MIPEEQYQKILKSLPIFCLDWVVHNDGKYLLQKRTLQPLKGVWWIVGGRMRVKETLEDAAIRLQTREFGRYLGLGEMIGFSNYIFPEVEDSRAIHTPAISFLVDSPDQFTPTQDVTECGHMWTSKLPSTYVQETTFFREIPYSGTIDTI